MIESVSDAAFAPRGGRSVGAAQIFWAGSLVFWRGGRQPFAAASTAEAELLSLAEAFMLARAMEPLIAALHRFNEAKNALRKGLFADNTATLQLRQLESGSWKATLLSAGHAFLVGCSVFYTKTCHSCRRTAVREDRGGDGRSQRAVECPWLVRRDGTSVLFAFGRQ